MMYGLKWNVVSHSSPASVPCSAFPFFLFFFFRRGSTISSSKKKKNEDAHYFPTRENCFWVQLNLSTLGKEESGHCRQVTVVERLKQGSVYGPCPPRKKNGRCRGVTAGCHCREMAVGGRCGEVVVSGGSTVFWNSSECLIQISTTLHNLNLTSTNTEKPNEFSSLQSKGVTTKWTLKD